MATDTIDTDPDARGSLTHVCLGLVWLGITAYATHLTITGNGPRMSGALALAVAALPGVIAAALVTGASIGAVAAGRRRSAGRRLLAGLIFGSVLGLTAAASIRFGYGFGDSAALMTLAITVGAASIVGGAVAVLPPTVLKAGLWGTTWVFVAGVIFGVLQPNLVKLLGGFVLGQSLLTGLVAAWCVSRSLRVGRHRVAWCLIGGALPGFVLLAAEWLTRIGGSAMAQLVHGFPSESPPLTGLSEPARLRHALIVLAVGGPVAMLLSALKSLRDKPRPVRPSAGVEAFHRDLARVGLDAGERYGFALAGGYAVQAAGFLKRPSQDVDLFTVWERRDEFEPATRAIVDAYTAAGWSVESEHRHDTFTRLTVSDGLRTATVELGLDRRANEPVRTSIGPVLHPDDAVANKTRALYERAHAADFIDLDAVLRSGRYDRSTLLELAARSDITFDRSLFADALARAQLLSADEVARYGLAGKDLEGLRQRYALWRDELLDGAGLTT